MKKSIIIASGIFLTAFFFTACENLFNVDSELVASSDDLSLDTPEEVFYIINGIFHELDNISERYVLLGELRGELMEVSTEADNDLQEIYNFNISQENKYNQISDYYSIINNCNYLVKYIDTSQVSSTETDLLAYLAAAKSIRAWTYMQIAFNYGTVKYFEDPLLDISYANEEFPEYTIDQLVPELIEDLETVKEVPTPDGEFFGEEVNSSSMFFPVRQILGELYMWTEDYLKAAQEFRDMIYYDYISLYATYNSTWYVENREFIDYYPRWENVFNLVDGRTDQISLLAGSTEYGEGAPLDSLSINSIILPTDQIKQMWFEQTYYYSASINRQGDLRSKSSIVEVVEDPQLNELFVRDEEWNKGTIRKFVGMSTETSRGVHVYRRVHPYLRYAEAINRAGNPNTAFAVLKNGLKEETFRADSIIPVSEKYSNPADSTLYSYMDFSRFTYNYGVHSRGCGNVQFAVNYRIPSLPTLQDSILYVEDKIIEELALETAFEGGRFHDLMRIALRRDDPSYLADRVSAKYPEGQEAEMKSFLMDPENWYIEK